MDEQRIVSEYLGGESILSLSKKYRVGHSSIRKILLKYGIKPRELSEQLLYAREGWRKLSKLNTCKTRLVSIPTKFLVEAGVNPEKELFGKWVVRDKGRLELILREG